MAQLPGILQNAAAPLPYEQFREISSRFLSAYDMQILASLSLEPPKAVIETGSSVVDNWYDWERSLRFSLKKLRAAKLKREFSAAEEMAGSSGFNTAQIASAASGLDNPLEAELFLNKARTDAVGQFATNHYFDSDAVFAYGIMLLLHERRDQFTAEAGRASYTSIYNQILGEYA